MLPADPLLLSKGFPGEHVWSVRARGVHISMGKFQSGFLKKHIAVPGCILLPEHKYVRVERFDPGK